MLNNRHWKYSDKTKNEENRIKYKLCSEMVRPKKETKLQIGQRREGVGGDTWDSQAKDLHVPRSGVGVCWDV